MCQNVIFLKLQYVDGIKANLRRWCLLHNDATIRQLCIYHVVIIDFILMLTQNDAINATAGW